MLPYPSGELHMGHLKTTRSATRSPTSAAAAGFRCCTRWATTPSACRPRTPRSRPANRRAWRPSARSPSFRADQRLGFSIDWAREVATHEPEYYRWTQWIFLRLFERGLAYRKEAPVKWCPNDQTVLANEQVIDGRCERCGTEVDPRKLEQWFFKITDYADRLLDDMDALESWPEHVMTMQRNWIGRSEGAEVVFRGEELDLDFPVFTTRPDTLFGATFFVLAPEHPLVEQLVAGTPAEAAVRDYVDRVGRESAEERGAEDREKTGVRSAARASTRSTASRSRSGSPTTC